MPWKKKSSLILNQDIKRALLCTKNWSFSKRNERRAKRYIWWMVSHLPHMQLIRRLEKFEKLLRVKDSTIAKLNAQYTHAYEHLTYLLLSFLSEWSWKDRQLKQFIKQKEYAEHPSSYSYTEEVRSLSFLCLSSSQDLQVIKDQMRELGNHFSAKLDAVQLKYDALKRVTVALEKTVFTLQAELSAKNLREGEPQ